MAWRCAAAAAATVAALHSSFRPLASFEPGASPLALPVTLPSYSPSHAAAHAPQVLLKLDLAETREFFAAFFALSDFHWHGFLSSRLSFLQLIGFGLSLFAKSSNAARANLLQKGLPGLLIMLARLATLKA